MNQIKLKRKIVVLITAFLGLGTLLCNGQIQYVHIDSTSLPKGIKYEGKIKSIIKWTDRSGYNIVITAETGEHPSKLLHDEDSRDAELFAYHFISKSDTLKQLWKVYDFIKDCPFDIEAKFFNNILQVTDLSKDSIPEIWLMYKISCKSDVSPSDMKIIMYQGQQKFAMRGQNKVKVSDTEYFGGDYKFDKAFTEGPEEFREFAKKLLNINIIQSWE